MLPILIVFNNFNKKSTISSSFYFQKIIKIKIKNSEHRWRHSQKGGREKIFIFFSSFFLFSFFFSFFSLFSFCSFSFLFLFFISLFFFFSGLTNHSVKFENKEGGQDKGTNQELAVSIYIICAFDVVQEREKSL